MVLSGWYALFSCYLTISAWKNRAKYSIPRRRWNLMNMTQHCIFFVLVPLLVIFDQLVVNIAFQVFYSSLGPDLVFQIWWLWHLLMFSIINILAPMVICYNAHTHYPEFKGLEARRLPGQEKTRMERIIPRIYLENKISSRDPSTVEHYPRAQSCRLAGHSRNMKVFDNSRYSLDLDA